MKCYTSIPRPQTALRMKANACASRRHACLSPAHPAKVPASALPRLDLAAAALWLGQATVPQPAIERAFFIPGSLWIEDSYPREIANQPQSLDSCGFPPNSKNCPREIANQTT